MPTNNRIVGITLVVMGVLILLGEMGLKFFGWLWPVLLCAIGGWLLWSWYTRSDDSGKVFSGTLLVLLAFFFLFMRGEDAEMMRHWPFFVLAPGIALLVMSRVDRSRRDASVPGWIAVAVALVLYFFTSGLFMGLVGFIFGLIGLVLRLLVPLGLVALGGWMIMNYRQRGQYQPAGTVPEKFEPESAPADEEEEDPTELDTSVGPIPAVQVDNGDEWDEDTDHDFIEDYDPADELAGDDDFEDYADDDDSAGPRP